VEIRAGLAGAWTSLITGEADRLEIDIGRGEVRVEGRDLTSRFIEAPTQESFENQTASDIVKTLAARRGLISAVTPTFTTIGRDYQSSYSRTTLDQHARATTEWDLLIRLAEGEGFDVWVDGQVLYFAPPDQTSSLVKLTPSDCLSVQLERLMSLSGGVSVSVKSWDCRGQTGVLQTATSTSEEAPKSYVVVRPNLSAETAQAEARKLLIQMCQHERGVRVEMPGDLTTQPRDLLALASTGTDFDGLWTVSSVERRISFRNGFVQTLQARLPAWTTF
jgi:phage protein D